MILDLQKKREILFYVSISYDENIVHCISLVAKLAQRSNCFRQCLPAESVAGQLPASRTAARTRS